MLLILFACSIHRTSTLPSDGASCANPRANRVGNFHTLPFAPLEDEPKGVSHAPGCRPFLQVTEVLVRQLQRRKGTSGQSTLGRTTITYCCTLSKNDVLSSLFRGLLDVSPCIH